MSAASRYLALGPNGEDWYFTGDVERAMAYVRTQVEVDESADSGGDYGVHFSYGVGNHDEAEWGTGPDVETARRYALGAHFGPLDDEYPGDGYIARLLGEDVEA